MFATTVKECPARERLLALRGRCRGSRLKTCTNAYRAAWKSGEVLNDPEAVYAPNQGETPCLRGKAVKRGEVRVDGEHASLAKFEPLHFEAVDRRVGGGRLRQDAPRTLSVLSPEDGPASPERD